ncbi:hypothetical protein HNP84_003084 [Thermocatellispora tengchongensis]|uniref:Uncharacterized protein n=1 Tax=Thermocatellispora tengchongensis TaxID=1073253 RepID=A0A840P0X8_9ACTN|nr:hypothetical protein [Thermocatellispora tengchongensis]MBB5133358.1 hypothetical protein [Thermocatellispora tengchongensis]
MAATSAAAAVTAGGRREVRLPLIGSVTVPPPDRLVFYAALGALAALEIIDWPVALVVGAGHFLAEQHRSQILRELGEAAEAV